MLEIITGRKPVLRALRSAIFPLPFQQKVQYLLQTDSEHLYGKLAG